MSFAVRTSTLFAAACAVFVTVDAAAWKYADENFESALADQVHQALNVLRAHPQMAIGALVLAKFKRDVCDVDSAKGAKMRTQKYDVPRNKLLVWVGDRVNAVHNASEDLDEGQKSQIITRIDFWTVVWFCNIAWPAVPRRALSKSDQKTLARIIMPDDAESLNPVIDGNLSFNSYAH